jgi:sugar lactone lactonase YvrE
LRRPASLSDTAIRGSPLNDGPRRAAARLLASSFQGRQLNRPNDVVVKSDGAIYFTDPGMKVDTEGNVYCGGAGGIWIMDPKGKKLGRIVHGAPATTNIAFGGDDWKTLYFTSRNHLGAVNVKIPGIPVPITKK